VQALGDVYATLDTHRHVLIGEPTAAAWLARTALAAGRREFAAHACRAATEIARGNPGSEIALPAAAHCEGITGRDPALLAQAAAEHADPWARASASEDLGKLLAATGMQEDAVKHFDDALAGYGQTGAARDLARVRRRLRRLGVRRRHWTTAERPAVGWASLTETEQATAELVARGLSNQESAEQMFVSAHTVAFHLRQIFRKLGITSRVELARLVAEQANAAGGTPGGLDLRGGRHGGGLRRPCVTAPQPGRPAPQPRFSAWPPNSLRIAESAASVKWPSPRDSKRCMSAELMTGAGMPSSIAASTVQRPSPESETRPLKPSSCGERARASATRSTSHDPITEPRRHTSATSATSMSYW
jgi:DNA-binding CsgD family transcriptional regulator